MIRIDLHTHSTYSDGTCSVEQIVRLASRRGVSVLAITDHDTLDGVDAFVTHCQECGVRPVTGIELTAKSPFTAHILGYRILRPYLLREALSWILSRRHERNEQLCRRLRELGVEIDMAEVLAVASGGVPGRPHFAAVLLKKGYVGSAREAFSKYLARGGDAYVPREAYAPEECVRLIQESGGLPVFAHPSLTGLEDGALVEFLQRLRACGLWGLECITTHCSTQETYRYLTIAERVGLFPTAGSDFHGTRRPSACLGVQVSEQFLPWARLGVRL